MAVKSRIRMCLECGKRPAVPEFEVFSLMKGHCFDCADKGLKRLEAASRKLKREIEKRSPRKKRKKTK